ncbi:transmembrane bax inhibitor motif-containing protein-like protein 4 [Tirmania nivea]|nr:transmembrane bax inhibitor motif-containing protein-like protein 4 [Tirmania nivea]
MSSEPYGAPGARPQDPSVHYTRPPPAYPARHSAEVSPSSPLLGPAARHSMDNVPDDFKYSVYVADATVDIRMAFIRKVYAILSVQLAATAIFSSISFFNASFKHWIQSNGWMMFLSIFGSIAFLLLTLWKRHSYPSNLIFLSVFTFMEAYCIGLVVSFYDAPIVIEAVLITLGIFIGLTLFACQSKYDFTGWQPWLFGLLTGVVIFGFVSMFFPRNSAVELFYSAAVAILFSAYILVDTQLIMRKFHVEDEIAAAISLYLDILNLFLAILRILNSSNND